MTPADESTTRALTCVGGVVAVDTDVSPELETEGVARDVVRLVQDVRRREGLYVSDRIRQIGLRHGAMLYSRRQNQGRYGEWSLIAPPLIITQSQADELVDALEKSVAEFTDEMTRAGVLQ